MELNPAPCEKLTVSRENPAPLGEKPSMRSIKTHELGLVVDQDNAEYVDAFVELAEKINITHETAPIITTRQSREVTPVAPPVETKGGGQAHAIVVSTLSPPVDVPPPSPAHPPPPPPLRGKRKRKKKFKANWITGFYARVE